MLKSFSVVNFKSYKEATLPLGPLTVLIGANASGKSNIIEGLRLLSWMALGNRLSLLQQPSESGDFVIRGRTTDYPYLKGDSFSFFCEASFEEYNKLEIKIESRKDGLHIIQESISGDSASMPLYSIVQSSEGLGNDVRISYNNFLQGGNKPRIICNDQYGIFTQLTSEAPFLAAHRKSKVTIPSATRRFQKLLQEILFLDPVPSRMRSPGFRDDFRLHEDGRNLSGVLYHLWDKTETGDKPFPEQRERLLSFIQSLPEQRIDSLAFLEGARSDIMLKLCETFGNVQREYEAVRLSDGTLRVLAIAAAMLSAPKESMVVIEEVDNGVHPSRARHLLEQIRSVADEKSLRIVLTTHNPALLDALPNQALADVVFCYRDPLDGASRLLRLRDLHDFAELIAQGSLGDLLTSGDIDRFAKNRVNPSEKKKKALDWLDSLAEGRK